MSHRDRLPRKIQFSGLIAAVLVALVVVSIAKAEAPQFTPVDSTVGPVSTSSKDGLTVFTFNVYMMSLHHQRQAGSSSLYLQTCNGNPLKMSGHTRHLASGETLLPVKGGGPYDAVSAMQWTRPMGVPAQGATLRLSFFGPQSGAFCLQIWDAASLDGGRFTEVYEGMK